MSGNIPFDYSHSKDGNVLIQDLTEWTGGSDGLAAVSREWLSLACQDHIIGSVSIFGEELSLGSDAQEELAKEWEPDAREADIDRIGYVSDGIKAHAVSANLDVDYEVRTFSDLDEAIVWAGRREQE